MRHFVVYSGLFLTFVGAQSATKYLDAYSGHYVNCAQKWKTTVAMAEGKPALAQRLLDMMDTGEMTAEGQACPALYADHDATLRGELKSYLVQKRPNQRRLSLR